MSFSLYGALPPSKTGKDSEKVEPSATNTPPTTNISGLYSSLPAPESGSTTFQKDSNESTPVAETPPAPTPAPTPAQPTGWSAFNKFRPVIRRPTIQAKPKLNKPFIPSGATVVSTKTITREEKAIEQSAHDTSLATKTTETKDNIDLGAIPFLTTADDVNGFRANQKSKKKGKKGKLANNAQPLPTVFNMLEDYDPHRPNDYEQYKEERKELREQQRKKREWEKRQHQSTSRSRSRTRSRSRSPYSYYSRSPSPEPIIPTAKNEPPKINVKESAEEAYNRRMMMSQQKPAEQRRVEEVNPALDIATKILAKYNLQEGETETEQDSTSRGFNTVIEQKPVETEKPSPVILLTNMVGPGEVDDMLQEETADECSKYGKVERCLIFEVPKGKIHADKAVRIFVKFSDIEAARRAITDLNGRFFGGRIVTASFFDNGRFERLDLAPSPEEFHNNSR